MPRSIQEMSVLAAHRWTTDRRARNGLFTRCGGLPLESSSKAEQLPEERQWQPHRTT